MTEVNIIYPFDKDAASNILKGKQTWYVPSQRATVVPNTIMIYLTEARSIIGSVDVVEEVYRSASTIYNLVYPDEEDTWENRHNFWEKNRSKSKMAAYRLKNPKLFSRPMSLSELLPDKDGPRNGVLYHGPIPEEVYV